MRHFRRLLLLVLVGLGLSIYSSYGAPAVDLAGLTASGNIPMVQVPEPSNLVAGALLLLPFGAITLRLLRRGRRA